ncbi:MAG: glutathione S-transferase family protein [Deltaproteobacteria bacterium]|nr:glutathione S-transferase family protein [Deltaproteobacteria bacterium]
MIILYKAPPGFGLPSVSPFCVKLEAHLRLAEIEYQVKLGSPKNGPRNKVPWIEDGATVVADSQLIIEYLVERYGDRLDGGLSAEQRATAHVLRRMLEEGTYWVGGYEHWIAPRGFAHYSAAMRSKLPPLLGWWVMKSIRKAIRGQLDAQGTGRYSAAEITALGAADFRALATILGDKPFVLGDQPTSIDAVACAFFAGIFWSGFDSPIRNAVEDFALLEAYGRRIWQRCFTDYPLPAAP